MKKTKQIVPNKAIFKDREKEAEFWEKNYKDAWAKGDVKLYQCIGGILPPYVVVSAVIAH